jgi:hypothetical protein
MTVTRAKPVRLEIRAKPETPEIGAGQAGPVTRVKQDGLVTKACKVRLRRVLQESTALQAPIRDEQVASGTETPFSLIRTRDRIQRGSIRSLYH